MRKRWLLYGAGVIVVLFGLLAGGYELSKKTAYKEEKMTNMYTSFSGMSDVEISSSEVVQNKDAGSVEKGSSQMMAYRDSVTLSVADTEAVMTLIVKETERIDGMVVSSYINQEKEETRANVEVRVPSVDRLTFLGFLSKAADDVIEQRSQGEDVTEQYVDNESRLKGKKKLEERLIHLLEKADETEDLIRVSNEIERVQTEIEQLEGKQRYLKGVTDYARVSIQLVDASVYVPDVAKSEDLKTGEKIKHAFVSSINTLMGFFSGLIVFIVGYSPIIALGILCGIVLNYWYKKKKKRD
ncbi:DUF4349 domain-containing protein (plasmid) [Pontibacillus sp. ALD_SL1]|uniref:DUF4349 domain-containing protein n=1 Tax=Pontibacillus sp. ALD_SL1 TaxID=2777185 RepID=UPI001A96B378|nr:DUF4349 domain-containing protein [Pontibacillus sp. ALD_SL1]QST02270.1 DUF4349 domain-containing protein [Pontibacillus sp. ALD_SL1]